MPLVRIVSPAEAAAWPPEQESIDADALLTAVVGANRVGLTRMEYPDNWGWMARVYGGGRTWTRFWADAAHGGPEAALRKAVAWRDAQRQQLGPRQRRGPTWRIVRVDRPEHKNVGYFAYGDRRRYFSDANYGGPAGARAAAEAWLAARHSTPRPAAQVALER
jgi:hypothetical protein